jgi:SAM-dependent methyltransferase
MWMKDYLITGISYIRQSAKRKLIAYAHSLRGKKGLEIGGPSSLFSLKGYFPVYLFAGAIDGINYSTDTIWEGHITEGNTYSWHNRKGYQYIKEATDLSGIADNSYDFILSCHSLEHIANPLKAIAEWVRVLKPGGLFILVLPDKRYTFDIDRPYTTMEHLLEDYRQNTGEEDTTHFSEVISTHNFSMDKGIVSREELEKRVYANAINRCLHHHVFNNQLVQEIMHHFSLTVIEQQDASPFHLVTIAKKDPS